MEKPDEPRTFSGRDTSQGHIVLRTPLRKAIFIAGLVGIVITAALFLRMLQKLFLGPLPDRWAHWPDLGWVERAGLGVLLGLVIGIGVAPAWVLDLIDTFAGPFVGR